MLDTSERGAATLEVDRFHVTHRSLAWMPGSGGKRRAEGETPSTKLPSPAAGYRKSNARPINA
jgi:hypothetical protein